MKPFVHAQISSPGDSLDALPQLFYVNPFDYETYLQTPISISPGRVGTYGFSILRESGQGKNCALLSLATLSRPRTSLYSIRAASLPIAKLFRSSSLGRTRLMIRPLPLAVRTRTR